MMSPFPGMDPYLEGSLWTTVHAQLAVEITRQLVPKIRPRYLALTTERFVFEEPDTVAITTVYPDVGVVPAGTLPVAPESQPVAAAPLRVPTVVPEAVPHVSVELRDRQERVLVAAIELLSPTNKRGEGRQEYLARRRRLLTSSAHLMEIDLLRKGRRVPMQRELPDADYFVLLSRADQRPVTEVWPIDLKDTLPLVPVPLLPEDPDVTLDLDLAFRNVYDLGGYDLAVDYSRQPDVPLEEKHAQWAAERIRQSRA